MPRSGPAEPARLLNSQTLRRCRRTARKHRHASRRHLSLLADRGPGPFRRVADEQAIPWQLIPLDEGAAVPASPARVFRHRHDGRADERQRPAAVDRAAVRPAARRDRRRRAGDRALPRRAADGEGARCAASRAAPTPEIGWLHVDVCDRGARREWFGGLPRFAAFEWHYDAFDLPPMATRVLTNAFNADQGFIIDDRHIGFQCHIEMTRELVETWCRRGADELPARSNAHLQSAADLLADLARAHRRAEPGGRRRLRALVAGAQALMAVDPGAARPADQPDRRGRSGRAAGGGAEGTARERARRGRHANRRRTRRRRHQAHPRRRQRQRHRARGPCARGRAPRHVEDRSRCSTSRRSRRWDFAARRWRRSRRCRAWRSRRAPRTSRTRGASRSTAAP